MPNRQKHYINIYLKQHKYVIKVGNSRQQIPITYCIYRFILIGFKFEHTHINAYMYLHMIFLNDFGIAGASATVLQNTQYAFVRTRTFLHIILVQL